MLDGQFMLVKSWRMKNKLQAQNVTRWNSQLNMIQSVLKVPEDKLNSVGCNATLSTYEPRRQKTGLRGFRPGPTQTGLHNHSI